MEWSAKSSRRFLSFTRYPILQKLCSSSTNATMSTKPIFVATHPIACSTAFERVRMFLSQDNLASLTPSQVFMTCRNTLSCVHEPFGDAWYFGPERLSPRYASDDLAKNARARAGFDDFTYQNVFESMESRQAKEVCNPTRLPDPTQPAPIVCCFGKCKHAFVPQEVSREQPRPFVGASGSCYACHISDFYYPMVL